MTDGVQNESSLLPFRREPGLVRTIFMVFLLLTCLRVWLGPQGAVEPAQAQIPDAGAQRERQLDEARRTNELLSDIKRILEGGTLNVRWEGADNQGETRGVRPRKPSKSGG